MDLNYKENKGFRLLGMSERLNKGDYLHKDQLAVDYGVSEKTIQRDIEDLRAYMAETHLFERDTTIVYDKRQNAYHLVRMAREWLSDEEVLALSKVLLESRAFCKDELEQILSKLLMQVAPDSQKEVASVLQSERFHYVPLHHGKALIAPVAQLSQYIAKQEIVELAYTRKDGVNRTHQVKPVAVLFSEYYFYLICYMADDSKDYPTVFRIDRIASFQGTGQHFSVPYRERFSDGDFRKRVQFMFSGPLHTVQFTYKGPSIEAVLDRLPTAEVVSESDDGYVVRAEVYGNGIDMWLRSQGDWVNSSTP